MDHNGAIWSEGEPSSHQFRAAHDAVPDHNGVMWFTDLTNPERTIGRMDPSTGKVTGYKLADAEGNSVQSHGMAIDKDNNVWFTNGREGTFTKFNPKTEQFTRFTRPDSMVTARGRHHWDRRPGRAAGRRPPMESSIWIPPPENTPPSMNRVSAPILARARAPMESLWIAKAMHGFRSPASTA